MRMIYTRIDNVVRLRYNKLLHISRTKRKQKLRNDSQNLRVVGRLTRASVVKRTGYTAVYTVRRDVVKYVFMNSMLQGNVFLIFNIKYRKQYIIHFNMCL